MPVGSNITSTACQTGFPVINLEITSIVYCSRVSVHTDVWLWEESRRQALVPELWIPDGLASHRDPETNKLTNVRKHSNSPAATREKGINERMSVF